MDKEPTAPILSFEEFTARHPERPGMFPPRYNNFKLFFEGDPIKAKKLFFQQLVQEQPDLVDKIVAQFQDLELIIDFNDSRREAIRNIEPDMYEAYKIMRSYGAEDEDLLT